MRWGKRRGRDGLSIGGEVFHNPGVHQRGQLQHILGDEVNLHALRPVHGHQFFGGVGGFCLDAAKPHLVLVLEGWKDLLPHHAPFHLRQPHHDREFAATWLRCPSTPE